MNGLILWHILLNSSRIGFHFGPLKVLVKAKEQLVLNKTMLVQKTTLVKTIPVLAIINCHCGSMITAILLLLMRPASLLRGGRACFGVGERGFIDVLFGGLFVRRLPAR